LTRSRMKCALSSASIPEGALRGGTSECLQGLVKLDSMLRG
jgi:hypothetical protein